MKNNIKNTISIQGEIDYIDFNDWSDLFNISKSNKDSYKSFNGEINVKYLEIMNRVFENISLIFTSSNKYKEWNISQKTGIYLIFTTWNLV